MGDVFNQKLLHVGGGVSRGKPWQRLYLRLPSDWVEKMGLAQGDEVSVRVYDDCLIIKVRRDETG